MIGNSSWALGSPGFVHHLIGVFWRFFRVQGLNFKVLWVYLLKRPCISYFIDSINKIDMSLADPVSWSINYSKIISKWIIQTHVRCSLKHSIWTGHRRSSQQSNNHSQAFLNRIKICFNEIDGVWKYYIDPDTESESIIIGSKIHYWAMEKLFVDNFSTFVCHQDYNRDWTILPFLSPPSLMLHLSNVTKILTCTKSSQ